MKTARGKAWFDALKKAESMQSYLLSLLALGPVSSSSVVGTVVVCAGGEVGVWLRRGVVCSGA